MCVCVPYLCIYKYIYDTDICKITIICLSNKFEWILCVSPGAHWRKTESCSTPHMGVSSGFGIGQTWVQILALFVVPVLSLLCAFASAAPDAWNASSLTPPPFAGWHLLILKDSSWGEPLQEAIFNPSRSGKCFSLNSQISYALPCWCTYYLC